MRARLGTLTKPRHQAQDGGGRVADRSAVKSDLNDKSFAHARSANLKASKDIRMKITRDNVS
jgi:hypothetical protein